MAKKMPRGLVALSASAVAAIYFAGYLTTQAADPGPAPALSAAPAPITTPAPAAPTALPTLIPRRPQPSAPTSAPTSAAGPAAAYRDGVYRGSGTSRRGGFQVAVTIQGGRITNVALTRVTTQYPASRIAGLPGQVVARQSAQVDRVSGATYSVQAFQQAVQQALNQAGVTSTAAAPTDATAG